MKMFLKTSRVQVIHGECLDVLRKLPDNSMDAVCTDPPYGLSNTDPAHVAETIVKWASGEREYTPKGRGFMGQAWDAFVPPPAVWDECFRVLKPGGHLLCFAGTRTVDLMTLGIRLAGFDIRDSLAWIYGTGFPKSMSMDKAIESHLKHGKSNPRSLRQTEQDGDGEAYTLTGKNNGIMGQERVYDRKQFEAETDEALAWQGWGTALKPAIEPIVMARKPFKGTLAVNVLEHGVGALNINATRIAAPGEVNPSVARRQGAMKVNSETSMMVDRSSEEMFRRDRPGEADGRWPANVILDESQAASLDEQSGTLTSGKPGVMHVEVNRSAAYGAESRKDGHQMVGYGDSGGASRFFYVAKPTKNERPVYEDEDGEKVAHSTVKPLTLMRYLVKLVTPAGGIVLDPFAGSGTTVEAALMEGFKSLAIEAEPKYLPLIKQRVDRQA